MPSKPACSPTVEELLQQHRPLNNYLVKGDRVVVESRNPRLDNQVAIVVRNDASGLRVRVETTGEKWSEVRAVYRLLERPSCTRKRGK